MPKEAPPRKQNEPISTRVIIVLFLIIITTITTSILYSFTTCYENCTQINSEEHCRIVCGINDPRLIIIIEISEIIFIPIIVILTILSCILAYMLTRYIYLYGNND